MSEHQLTAYIYDADADFLRNELGAEFSDREENSGSSITSVTSPPVSVLHTWFPNNAFYRTRPPGGHEGDVDRCRLESAPASFKRRERGRISRPNSVRRTSSCRFALAPTLARGTETGPSPHPIAKLLGPGIGLYLPDDIQRFDPGDDNIPF